MAAGPAEGGRIVLIAVDASDHSRAAFDYLMANIYRKNDTIVLCHIGEIPHLPTLSFKRDGLHLPVEEWQRVIEDQIQKVNKLESDYEADLIARKVHYKITGDHHRNIGEAIMMEAEKEKADLIVVGTRGLSGIRRTLLGSVSDYVVRHSAVPVLVCPSKK